MPRVSLGRALAVVLCTLGPLTSAARAQSERTRTALDLGAQYRVIPNQTYLTASNWEAKLDIYAPRDTSVRAPTLVYIHGGGWVGGAKEQNLMALMPYLMNGWTVVNVEYRLGRIAQAPAAVEDCRCALRWILERADQYGIDRDRVVVTGHSAGGHLSLTTGMLPVSAGLDRECAGTGEITVAAIVNWYGITDVVDLLDGPNTKSYAVAWLGSRPDRNAIAEWLSPLTYVRPGLPPIITIHGDADGVVPYAHATRLHAALDAAGVPNELVTIPGGGHGGFPAAQNAQAYAAIEGFLAKHAGITQH
ncbi:MAG: alpha/beta hydrolase [Gemmatimonadota bacterium]|nr:alpha/beta hydrolase [Gemmatimonadota bacterium]MDH5198747.1 alpha/beta hydrolase [Gemmatimonadota bacterium]